MKTLRALALIAVVTPLINAPAMADPIYSQEEGLSKEACLNLFYAPVRLLGGASGALIGGPASGISGTIDKMSEATNAGDALEALYLAPLNIIKSSVDCGGKGFEKPFAAASFGVTD